jgi:hypothetical protein
VTSLLRSHGLQANLSISQPGDPYEQEADRVAAQVMHLPETEVPANEETQVQTKSLYKGITPLLQRLPQEDEDAIAEEATSQRMPAPELEDGNEEVLAAQREDDKEAATMQLRPLRQRQVEEEGDESLQAKPWSGQVTPHLQPSMRVPAHATSPLMQRLCTGCEENMQRQPEEEEELAQPQPMGNRLLANEAPALQPRGGHGQTPQVTSPVSAYIQALHSGGSPLPQATRAFFEPRFGADFSPVRVHTDTRAAETAKTIHARAFTVGRNIAFGTGQYAPESREGQQLLAHELTHVVQQGSAKAVDASLIRREEAAVEGGPAAEDTGETARRELEGITGRAVRKPGRISREQFLRQVPDPRKGENIVATLQFNNAVFVEEMGGKDDGWYKIISETGQQGWIPTVSVALEPPEPSAELYEVQPGDKAINLAGRWYGPPGGWKRWWWPGSDDAGDARFYVGALAFANKGRAGMPSPADLTERDAWMQVRVIEGLTIWKPSKQFLQTLRGKVSSGSITKELWEDVKKVAKAIWEFVVFAAAFIAGLLYGAGESIYDLFAGVVDLAKMAWSIGKSLFTGNIISDAKKFWEDLQKIDVKALGEDFLQKWFAADPWDAGFFQGRVLGYVIMEIVMLVLSAGALTAIKWAGKFAKIGALIAKLPRVAKVVEAVKGTEAAAKLRRVLSKGVTKGGELGKNIPGKHILLLAFRRATKVKRISAVSLKRLRNTLGRAGVSPKPYSLRKVSKAELKALKEAGADVDHIYGWVARDGAGNLVRDFRGRPIITFTEKGLSSLEEAVKTFGHEVKHIKDFAAGLKTSSEALAELAGEQLWVVVSKSLKGR